MAMVSLPVHSFSLQGGCFCKAIIYKINVPDFELRPSIPRPPQRPYGPQPECVKKLPIIALDHCNSCRRVAGSILQSWIICLQSWVQFTLVLRDEGHTNSGPLLTDDNGTAAIEPSRITPDTLAVLVPSKELEEATYVKGFESSRGAQRTFCGRCGTNLTFAWTAEDDEWGTAHPHLDIAMGTLEKESVEMEGMRPARESWAVDAIGWVKEMIAE